MYFYEKSSDDCAADRALCHTDHLLSGKPGYYGWIVRIRSPAPFYMVYAFLLPRLGFNGKQILFWNLLLKLCNIPLILLILVVTLVMMVVGGEGIRDDAASMVLIAWLSCCLIQLSSVVFGISGFRWCRKYGTLSKAGAIVSSIAQFVPCVDVIGSILCYIMFRKEGQEDIAM